jgi:hypothetical protein
MMSLQKKHYCTCGGQKNCFKCDGKGWIDELETGSPLDGSNINLPPVLKEHSKMSESDFEHVDFGRKRPLVTQAETVDSVPSSSSNMEATRSKQRKLMSAAKKAAMNQDGISLKNRSETQEVKKKNIKPIAQLPTNEQRKQQKEIITLLSSPHVMDFIDFRKLKTSDAFVLLTEFAAEHALTSGDSTYIVKVLSIFKNTEDFDGLLKWFCLRTALESKLVDGNIRFNKSENVPNKELSIYQFINDTPTESYIHKTSQRPTRIKSKVTDATKKKKKYKKIDLLDSRLILPGSYGAGKHR